MPSTAYILKVSTTPTADLLLSVEIQECFINLNIYQVFFRKKKVSFVSQKAIKTVLQRYFTGLYFRLISIQQVSITNEKNKLYSCTSCSLNSNRPVKHLTPEPLKDKDHVLPLLHNRSVESPKMYWKQS